MNTHGGGWSPGPTVTYAPLSDERFNHDHQQHNIPVTDDDTTGRRSANWNDVGLRQDGSPEHLSHSGGASTQDSDQNLAKSQARFHIPPAWSAPPPTRRRSFLDELILWKWEAAAVLVILAAFFAIIGTLYPFKDRPIPQLPIAVSINSLLSVYAVIMKAALIFVVGSCLSQLQWAWFSSERSLIDLVRYDNAARGPWGSAQLLWVYHLRQPVAALAALTTILFISLEPFVQQLVQYQDCSTVFAELSTTLPRTNYFYQRGVHSGPQQLSITPDMQLIIQSAVSTGVFLPNRAMTFDCPTGNCTFPEPYSTFGYCSACEEVSDTLRFQTVCFDANTGRPYNTTKSPGNMIFSDCERDNISYSFNITTSLPDNGLSITYAPFRNSPTLFKMGWAQVSGKEPAGTERYQIQILQGRSDFSDKRVGPFTSAAIEGCDNATTNNTWACRGYGAAICTLQPCVRTYRAEISAGILNETLIDSSDPLTKWGMGQAPNAGSNVYWSLLDINCTTAEENEKLRQLGYIVDLSKRWLPFNMTFNANFTIPADAPFPQSLLARQCLYIVNYEFTSSLWTQFITQQSGLLTGAVTGSTDSKTFVNAQGPQNVLRFYNYSRVDFASIDTTFHSIAESLTAYMRQNGQVNHSQPVGGTVEHYATCLSVEWSWAALPASLIVCTVIVFIATLASNARGDLPAWKSSPLAFLFHGPGGYGWHGVSRAFEPEKAGYLNSIEGMEDTARGVVVKLDRSGPLAQLVVGTRKAEGAG
jgi:hypothetical protein